MSTPDTVEQQVRDCLRATAAATEADRDLVARLIRTAHEGTSSPEPSPRRVVWLRPLLAAAAVAAVAATTAVLVTRPGHHRPAGTTSTSVSPRPSRPSPSTTPHAAAPLHPLRCTVATPAAWNVATWPTLGGSDEQFLAAGEDGDVLASSPAGGANGEVVLLVPGRSARVLYRLPSSVDGISDLRAVGGQLDGHWATVDVAFGNGEPEDLATEAIDLDTGATSVVRTSASTSTSIVSDPQLLNGHAYWSEVGSTGRGKVYAVDLATGRRSTLDHGTLTGPQVVGGAVEWVKDGRVVRHGPQTLPPGFTVGGKGTSTLLRDGTTYAWTAWAGSGRAQRPVVLMARAGMSGPETVYDPHGADVTPDVLALSGPFLVFEDSVHVIALDTRTGAAVRLAPWVLSSSAAAGNAALVVQRSGAGIVRQQVDALPELHC